MPSKLNNRVENLEDALDPNQKEILVIVLDPITGESKYSSAELLELEKTKQIIRVRFLPPYEPGETRSPVPVAG